MNTNLADMPIGLKSAVAAVKKTTEQAKVYRSCGLKLPHYIINLDAGNGQTTLTEYIAETYADYKVRRFGGLDLFLEYTLDGSMEQLRKMFFDIRSCAVYTNEFEGVIAMDISRLADHMNEAQVGLFLDKIFRISSSATLIFYVPSVMNRNVANLVGKLQTVLDHVEKIDIKPYSAKELAEIVKRMLADFGVVVKETMGFDEQLLNMILEKQITGVKGAKKLCQALVGQANFEGFYPKLGLAEIETIFPVSGNVKKEVM